MAPDVPALRCCIIGGFQCQVSCWLFVLFLYHVCNLLLLCYILRFPLLIVESSETCSHLVMILFLKVQLLFDKLIEKQIFAR